jgi:hypothetical protein
MRVTSSINRNDTFTKGDRPSNIVRSDTFILKHHSESSDELNNNYSRSRRNSGQRFDDKPNYSTYTRPEKKGKNGMSTPSA